jgi:hypothetical protein
MRRAARSCRDARDANSNPGPCGPLPSLPHRHRPASPGNTWASASPRWPTPRPPSTRPRWPTASATHAAAPPAPAPPAAGLVRPGAGHPDRAAPATAAPGPGGAARVDRATITRAIGQIRPLLAAPGLGRARPAHAAPADLGGGGADAAANGVQLRIHGTQTQVRRPHAHRPGRRAFLLRQAQAAAPSSPPWSATARAAPCGPGRCARAASTTRPRSTPRASPTC